MEEPFALLPVFEEVLAPLLSEVLPSVLFEFEDDFAFIELDAEDLESVPDVLPESPELVEDVADGDAEVPSADVGLPESLLPAVAEDPLPKDEVEDELPEVEVGESPDEPED